MDFNNRDKWERARFYGHALCAGPRGPIRGARSEGPASPRGPRVSACSAARTEQRQIIVRDERKEYDKEYENSLAMIVLYCIMLIDFIRERFEIDRMAEWGKDETTFQPRFMLLNK